MFDLDNIENPYMKKILSDFLSKEQEIKEAKKQEIDTKALQRLLHKKNIFYETTKTDIRKIRYTEPGQHAPRNDFSF